MATTHLLLQDGVAGICSGRFPPFIISQGADRLEAVFEVFFLLVETPGPPFHVLGNLGVRVGGESLRNPTTPSTAPLPLLQTIPPYPAPQAGKGGVSESSHFCHTVINVPHQAPIRLCPILTGTHTIMFPVCFQNVYHSKMHRMAFSVYNFNLHAEHYATFHITLFLPPRHTTIFRILPGCQVLASKG